MYLGNRYSLRKNGNSIVQIMAKLILIGLFFVFSPLHGAVIELDDTRPYGHIGSPSVYPSILNGDGSVLFETRFDVDQFTGDVVAREVSSDGVIKQDIVKEDADGNVYVTDDNAKWRAHKVLPRPGNRKIFTADKPFQWGSLGERLQNILGSKELLEWIRGAEDNEGAHPGNFRSRQHLNHKNKKLHYVLGDMPHSSVQYMGPPFRLINDPDYSQFRVENKTRIPVVFVGANDGMLHAFRASDGLELFAYIPEAILGDLAHLSDQNYTQSYWVDGTPNISDAKADFPACPAGGGKNDTNKCWRTVLLGGLGSGGSAIYALDVTNPAPSSASEAARMYLWEFSKDEDSDMGFSFSRPEVAKLSDGTWVAIFGNGIQDSGTSNSTLYIVKIEDGTLIQKLELVPAGSVGPNGLLSPTILDSDYDGDVDFVYTGDTDGNMWKIDVSKMTGKSGGGDFPGVSAYRTSRGIPLPLAKVTGIDSDDNETFLVIQTKPIVTTTSDGKRIVIFGTGRLFGGDEAVSNYGDSLFGILDNADSETGHGRYSPPGAPIASSFALKTYSPSLATPATIRVLSSGIGSRDVGWRIALENGERILTDPVLTNGRIVFTTVNPLHIGNINWLNGVNYETGGAPDDVFLDTNTDGQVNSQDMSGAAVPISLFLGHGIASNPRIVNINGTLDLNIVTRGLKRGEFESPFNDPGLLGGHFDLDTFYAHADDPEHETKACYYDSKGKGKKKKKKGKSKSCHTHEYDDNWDVNGVNMLETGGVVGTNPDVETATGILSSKHISLLEMMTLHTEFDSRTKVVISIVNPQSVDTQVMADARATAGIDDNVIAPPATIYFKCKSENRIVEFAPNFMTRPKFIGRENSGDRTCNKAGDIEELRIKFSDINSLRATEPSCVKDNKAGPFVNGNTGYRNGALVVSLSTVAGKVVYENANYEHLKKDTLDPNSVPSGTTIGCEKANEELRAYKDPEKFGGNPVTPPNEPPGGGTQPGDPENPGDQDGGAVGESPNGSIISEEATVSATSISSSRVSWREVLDSN